VTFEHDIRKEKEMAAYTIRVEFQGNPSYQQYESLHQSMAALGFLRTVQGVRSGTPVNVNLPTGLYYGYSNQTAIQVADGVHAAASRIHPVAAIFVAETTTWASKP
jgi:hypothetical protein